MADDVAVTSKTCPKCLLEKPSSDFWKQTSAPDGLQHRCKQCFYEYRHAADRRYMESGKHGAVQRENHYRRNYGIGVADVEAMYEAQGGCCLLCGHKPVFVLWDEDARKQRKRGLQVDHCHKTGRVRGLLCWNCNSGIGRLGDDPDLLLRAAIYVMEGEST